MSSTAQADAPADAGVGPRPGPSPLEPGREPTFGTGRTWTILAWAAPLLTLAVTVAVFWGTDWPAFPYDEVTLLQLARMLAGEQVPDVIRGAGYYPAWSVIIAPIWWFVKDPSTAYQVALWVGVPVSMLTIWPLARIVTRFGLAVRPAVVVASVVMLMPARTIQADFAMSERLVTLFVVVSVLAAYRVAERPTLQRHAVFALSVGLMLFAHVRMTGVIAAAGVWLLIRAVKRPKVSLAGLAMVVAAYLVANWAGSALNEALLGRKMSRGDDLLERLSDSSPQLFLRVIIGQSWYQSIASFGLVTLGVVVVVAIVWRELRRLDFGGTTFVLGGTLAVVFISLAQWANAYWLYVSPWRRLDVWIYGRYIDPLSLVVVAIGLAVLIAGASRAVLRWGVGLNVLVALVGAGYLTREVPTWGYVTPAHIPGILPWWRLLPTQPWDEGLVPTLTNGNRIWIIAPLCVLAVLVAVVLLRRRPAVVVGGLLVVAAVATVLSIPRSHQFHVEEERARDIRPLVQPLVTLGADEPIGIAADRGVLLGLEAVGQNYLGYAVTPSPLLEVAGPDDVRRGMELVLAPEAWPLAGELGARQLQSPSVYGRQVWVLPGALQDRLAAAGRLLPAASAAG